MYIFSALAGSRLASVRIDLRHARGGVREQRPRERFRKADSDLGLARDPQHRAHVHAGGERKAGAEDEFAGFRGVRAEQRRRVRSGPCVDREDALPAGGGLRRGVPTADAEDAPLEVNRGPEEEGEHYGSGTVRRSSDAPSPIRTRALASSYLSRCWTPLRLAMVS